MEDNTTRPISRKRTFSLSEKQKDIRKIEIPKAFVRNAQPDGFPASGNERPKRNMNQNMKDKYISLASTSTQKAGGGGNDVSEKDGRVSRDHMPRVTRRMSSTIRRIQDKIRKEQQKDMAGGGGMEEGLQQDCYAVAMNAVAVVRNARRQRSKSRTKQGKMRCDQLQRPYRRWLGVSTCVASDARFIVGPKRTGVATPTKTEKCRNNNETNDGSQWGSDDVQHANCPPSDTNQSEKHERPHNCSESVDSAPTGSQPTGTDEPALNSDSASSDHSSLSNPIDRACRPKQRRKSLRFHDSKTPQSPRVVDIDGGRVEHEGCGLNPPDEPMIDWKPVEPVSNAREDSCIHNDPSELPETPSEPEMLLPGFGTSPKPVVSAIPANVDTKHHTESPLPFEFSLQIVGTESVTPIQGDCPADSPDDGVGKAPQGQTTEHETLQSNQTFSYQPCDEYADGNMDEARGLIYLSKDECSPLKAGIFPLPAEEEPDEGCMVQYLNNTEDTNCPFELSPLLEIDKDCTISQLGSYERCQSPADVFPHGAEGTSSTQCLDSEQCLDSVIVDSSHQSQASYHPIGGETEDMCVTSQMQTTKDEGDHTTFEISPLCVEEEFGHANEGCANASKDKRDASGVSLRLNEKGTEEDFKVTQQDMMTTDRSGQLSLEVLQQLAEQETDGDATEQCLQFTKDESIPCEYSSEAEIEGTEKDDTESNLHPSKGEINPTSSHDILQPAGEELEVEATTKHLSYPRDDINVLERSIRLEGDRTGDYTSGAHPDNSPGDEVSPDVAKEDDTKHNVVMTPESPTTNIETSHKSKNDLSIRTDTGVENDSPSPPLPVPTSNENMDSSISTRKAIEEDDSTRSPGKALTTGIDLDPPSSKRRDPGVRKRKQKATNKRDQACLTSPPEAEVKPKPSPAPISPANSITDQGGLAGSVVSKAKFEFVPPIPPLPPPTPPLRPPPPSTNKKAPVKPPVPTANRVFVRNSLRQEMRTFRDRQLFDVKAFTSPSAYTLRSLAKKIRKAHEKKEYINVLAIKDCEGTLPGQLAFKKGQTIKQLDTGLRDVDGMFYGYYRVGRLRRKVWGIYPSTHISLFFDSDEENDDSGESGKNKGGGGFSGRGAAACGGGGRGGSGAATASSSGGGGGCGGAQPKTVINVGENGRKL